MTEFEKKFEQSTGEKFNVYYKTYKPKLSWYLTKYTKDLERAEEFADLAFIQGLEKIDTYNSELSQYITWLTSIAINLVIKDYKDKKKENTISIEKELSDNFSLNHILQYDDDSEDKRIFDENVAKCEKIKEVIYTLPDKYKKVMIMRELNNKPYKEIADEIVKEQEINLTYNNYSLDVDEYFKSVTITNNGTSNAEIKTIDGGYKLIISPNEQKEINKDEIENNLFIDSENTEINLLIKESTNLSTIKSQIRKGRSLIRKKVKKHFDLINKNGVE